MVNARLGLLAAGAVVLAVACRQKERTLYFPEPLAELEIVATYPGANGEIDTCAGVAAWLLWLDTTQPPDGFWEHTLLLSGDKTTLWGCNSGPCTNARFEDELVGLTRMMVEGITTSAGDFFASGTHDVVCRGVADDQLRDADITVATPAPTPSPGPEPVEVPAAKIVAHVRFLAVGRANPMPFVPGLEPKNVRYGAAASFSSSEDRIGLSGGAGDSRGDVLLAGGLYRGASANAATDEVWRFDPQELAFSPIGLVYGNLVGLSATTIAVDSSAGVIVAGGHPHLVSAVAPVPVANARIYGEGGSSRDVTLPSLHAFHGSARIQRGTPSAAIFAGSGRVLFVSTASEGSFSVAGGDYSSQVAAWVPAETPLGACPGVFDAPCSLLPVGNGRGFSVTSQIGSAGVVFFSGWDSNPSDEITHYDPQGQRGPQNVGTSRQHAGGTGAPFDRTGPFAGRALAIGGIDQSTFITGLISLLVPNVADSVSLTPALVQARLHPVAVRLRDGSILVFGGRNATGQGNEGLRIIERIAANSAEVIVVDGVALAGQACNAANGSGCSLLLEPRWAHTATRLEETASWLDGSVLIAGGAPLGAGGQVAELFVPAYQCGTGVTPVRPLGVTSALEAASIPDALDVCSRGRQNDQIEIDDPSLDPE